MKKESFLLYKALYEPIKDFSDEELGMLFRTIYEYQINPGNPVGKIPANVKMAFKFFQNQFRLDEQKYEEKILSRNRENGKKGGRPKKGEEKSKNPENPVGKMEPKKADNDNGNVNGNVDTTTMSEPSSDVGGGTEEEKKKKGKKSQKQMDVKVNLDKPHFSLTPERADKEIKKYYLPIFNAAVNEHHKPKVKSNVESTGDLIDYWIHWRRDYSINQIVSIVIFFYSQKWVIELRQKNRAWAGPDLLLRKQDAQKRPVNRIRDAIEEKAFKKVRDQENKDYEEREKLRKAALSRSLSERPTQTFKVQVVTQTITEDKKKDIEEKIKNANTALESGEMEKEFHQTYIQTLENKLAELGK